jgi:N-carbamoylputrescine amidase
VAQFGDLVPYTDHRPRSSVRQDEEDQQVSNVFTIGLIQDHATDSRADNIARAATLIRSAAAKGAQIICLKELFDAPYFCKSQQVERFDLAEPIPGATTDAMQALARELAVVLVVPIFERQAAGVYRNSAAVIDADGSLLGVYRKMHIPDDPLYYEKLYFTPGDLGFRVWKTSYGKIGVLICWDQWYPEGARLTAMQGAQILFYPTAIGWHPSEKKVYGPRQHGAWETIQRSHAVANGCYVAAVNRIGTEILKKVGGDGIEFWGQSFVAGTSGEILTKASVNKEEVLIVPVDLAQVDQTRTHWPFLRDRRIDAYGDITKRLID